MHSLRVITALVAIAVVVTVTACGGGSRSHDDGTPGRSPEAGLSTSAPVSTVVSRGGPGGLGIAVATLSCAHGVPNVYIAFKEQLTADVKIIVSPSERASGITSSTAPLAQAPTFAVPAGASAAAFALPPEVAPKGTKFLQVDVVADGAAGQRVPSGPVVLDTAGVKCLGGQR